MFKWILAKKIVWDLEYANLLPLSIVWIFGAFFIGILANFLLVSYFLGWKKVLELCESLQSCPRIVTVEPVCCKNRQKIVHDQLLVWGIGDVWRVPNWSYMIKGVIYIYLGPIWYILPIQNLQMSPIPQTSNWSWTFFLHSRLALVNFTIFLKF